MMILATVTRHLAPPSTRTRPSGRDLRRCRSRHHDRRLAVIQDELAAAEPGFVFLAGDSHAELLGWPALDRPVVNGGVGGASAASYAALLDQLDQPVRARLAILLIGTNDILRTAGPRLDATRARFCAHVTRIVDILQARTHQILVAAVPPIGAEACLERDPSAVGTCSDDLRDLCDREGCRFIDPFAGLRAGETGLARPGALVDGIHLADYGALAAALASSVAAELSAHEPTPWSPWAA